MHAYNQRFEKFSEDQEISSCDGDSDSGIRSISDASENIQCEALATDSSESDKQEGFDETILHIDVLKVHNMTLVGAFRVWIFCFPTRVITS